MTSPVDGDVASKAAPLSDGTQSPPTNIKWSSATAP
jgi:hypothetical protein